MKTKIVLILIVFLTFNCLHGWSQSTVSAEKLVGITAATPDDLDIPDDACKSLLNKLRSIASRSGYGSTSSAFFLVGEPYIIDKQMTPTVPAQFVVDVELSLYIYNNYDSVIVHEITIPLKGIHRLENKAMIAAINTLQPTNPNVRKFMNTGREKIVDYYTAKTPKIIEKAQQLAKNEEYFEAIKLLNSIPEFIDQYSAVLNMTTQIYQKMLAIETTKLIKKANAEIIKGNFIDALTIIVEVNPISPNSDEAYALMTKIDSQLNVKTPEVIELETKITENKNNAEILKDNKEELQKTVVESVQNEVEESMENTPIELGIKK